MNPAVPHLAQHIAKLFRENAKGNGLWANVFGSVEDSSAAPLHSTPLLNLGNAGIYLKFVSVATGHSSAPQMTRRLHAAAMGIGTRSNAWKWLAGRVNSHLPDPQWLNTDLDALECADIRRMCIPRWPVD